MSKHRPIHEEQEDRVEKELKDLDVPEKDSAAVKGGLRAIERDPTKAGQ